MCKACAALRKRRVKNATYVARGKIKCSMACYVAAGGEEVEDHYNALTVATVPHTSPQVSGRVMIVAAA